MTPTERAKRSDALYYETVSVTRRVLCDMIANREADLEDAKAESEHMRLKALAVAGELQEESERLKAENDKLRELVDELYPLADYGAMDASELDRAHDLMRELGGGRMSKEHAYAYEAGYRDGSIHYELEHCPACKNIAGLQEALADNDKLWDLNEHMRLKDMAIIGELEEENAKLRELVSGLEHCSQGFACDCCPLYDQSNTNHHGCESLERELGVEVDA